MNDNPNKVHTVPQVGAPPPHRFYSELEDSDKTLADYGMKGGRGVLNVRAVSRCFALFRGCLSLAFRSSSQ